jgi:hypothetical protein
MSSTSAQRRSVSCFANASPAASKLRPPGREDLTLDEVAQRSDPSRDQRMIHRQLLKSQRAGLSSAELLHVLVDVDVAKSLSAAGGELGERMYGDRFVSAAD